MKNLVKVIGIIALAAVIVFSFSCDDKKSSKEYTVTFNPNNGEDPFEQPVIDGKKAIMPEDPTRIYPPTGAGLYEGSLAYYTFGGWYIDINDEEAFDFNKEKITKNITLTAKWINPDPLPIPVPGFDPTSGTFIDDVIIGHVLPNPGPYTIALREDHSPYTFSGVDLKENFLNLTIIGIDPVTVMLNAPIIVGDAGKNYIEFVLGQNVTLDVSAVTAVPAVDVSYGASFTMQKGSSITGYNSDEVAVIIEDGSFYMNSGSRITGNISANPEIQLASGGLHLGKRPLSTVSGIVTAVIEGEISSNTVGAEPADITYFSDASRSSVTLSNEAVIGSIILVTTDTDYTNLNIDSSWTGTIDSLNLCYYTGADLSNSVDMTINKWLRYPNILMGFVNADIVNNVGLGKFIIIYNGISGDPDQIKTEDIAARYLIDNNGKIIPIPHNPN